MTCASAAGGANATPAARPHNSAEQFAAVETLIGCVSFMKPSAQDFDVGMMTTMPPLDSEIQLGAHAKLIGEAAAGERHERGLASARCRVMLNF